MRELFIKLLKERYGLEPEDVVIPEEAEIQSETDVEAELMHLEIKRDLTPLDEVYIPLSRIKPVQP